MVTKVDYESQKTKDLGKWKLNPKLPRQVHQISRKGISPTVSVHVMEVGSIQQGSQYFSVNLVSKIQKYLFNFALIGRVLRRN